MQIPPSRMENGWCPLLLKVNVRWANVHMWLKRDEYGHSTTTYMVKHI